MPGDLRRGFGAYGAAGPAPGQGAGPGKCGRSWIRNWYWWRVNASSGIELRPVTAENYRACIALEVLPEQRTFVAPNLNSLAEAYVYPAAEARMVYRGEEPVGFVLFHPVTPDRPADGHCIVRFMVDHRFQGEGIARPALRAAVDFIVREHGADRVRLSVVPENERARALYRSEGFIETGDLDDGELVMIKTISSPTPAGSGTG
jgi:diamine N-acetyltransferase